MCKTLFHAFRWAVYLYNLHTRKQELHSYHQLFLLQSSSIKEESMTMMSLQQTSTKWTDSTWSDPIIASLSQCKTVLSAEHGGGGATWGHQHNYHEIGMFNLSADWDWSSEVSMPWDWSHVTPGIAHSFAEYPYTVLMEPHFLYTETNTLPWMNCSN